MTTAKKLGAGPEMFFGVDFERAVACPVGNSFKTNFSSEVDLAIPKHKTHTSGLRKRVVVKDELEESITEFDEMEEEFSIDQIIPQSRISMSKIMGEALADGFLTADTGFDSSKVGRYSIINNHAVNSQGRYSFSDEQLQNEEIERFTVPAYKTIPPGMIDAEQKRILSSIPPELNEKPFIKIVESIRDRVMKRFTVLFPEKIEWWCSEHSLIRVWGQLTTGLSVLSDDQFRADFEGLMGVGFYWPEDTKAVRHYLENQIRNKFPDVDFDNMLEKPVRKT